VNEPTRFVVPPALLAELRARSKTQSPSGTAWPIALIAPSRDTTTTGLATGSTSGSTLRSRPGGGQSGATASKKPLFVGALVRLGRCIDLLDPSNAELLVQAHADLDLALKSVGRELKNNANTHKYRDCAVFNYLFAKLSQSNLEVESARAVFVPNNILAVWPVRKDGRYGKDQ
jgi:hypothetical protein